MKNGSKNDRLRRKRERERERERGKEEKRKSGKTERKMRVRKMTHMCTCNTQMYDFTDIPID